MRGRSSCSGSACVLKLHSVAGRQDRPQLASVEVETQPFVPRSTIRVLHTHTKLLEPGRRLRQHLPPPPAPPPRRSLWGSHVTAPRHNVFEGDAPPPLRPNRPTTPSLTPPAGQRPDNRTVSTRRTHRVTLQHTCRATSTTNAQTHPAPRPRSKTCSKHKQSIGAVADVGDDTCALTCARPRTSTVHE